MNKRAGKEATKALALVMGVFFVFIGIVWTLAIVGKHHPAWTLGLMVSVFAAGMWWMVYRDESR